MPSKRRSPAWVLPPMIMLTGMTLTAMVLIGLLTPSGWSEKKPAGNRIDIDDNLPATSAPKPPTPATSAPKPATPALSAPVEKPAAASDNKETDKTAEPAENSVPAELPKKPKTPKAPVVDNKPVVFEMAKPGYRYRFPADHASHPRFKTEWWYYTGHLKSAAGKRYGYELTFFRVGASLKNPPWQSRWRLRDVYAAHLALSDENGRGLSPGAFYFSERLGRNAPYAEMPGAAGALSDGYRVWNQGWSARLLPDGKRHQLAAADGPVALSLTLTPQKPPVVHGRNGISQKASCTGCASHYYSLTRLATSGTIRVNGETIPVTGTSWMDHEFGSNQLAENQTGWDWFSIQLDNQAELMLYVLRQSPRQNTGNNPAAAVLDPNSSGTLVDAQGRSRHLPLSAFKVEALSQWKSPKTGGVYPMGWRIRLPGEDIDLTLTPTLKDQELATTQSTRVAYWEGSVRVSGRYKGQRVSGRAYVEMTGYAAPFREKI